MTITSEQGGSMAGMAIAKLPPNCACRREREKGGRGCVLHVTMVMIAMCGVSSQLEVLSRGILLIVSIKVAILE